MAIKDALRDKQKGKDATMARKALQYTTCPKTGLRSISLKQYESSLVHDLDRFTNEDDRKEIAVIRGHLEACKTLMAKERWQKQQKRQSQARLEFEREKMQQDAHIETQKIAIGMPVGTSKEAWLESLKKHQENFKA